MTQVEESNSNGEHWMKVIITGLLSALLYSLLSNPSPAHINNSVAAQTPERVAQTATSQADEQLPNMQQQGPETVKTTEVSGDAPDAPQEQAKPVVHEQASTCANEVAMYDWPRTIAYEVMMVESSGNPDNQNDNSSTGDYSIGCFQINLLGEANLRAKYRDASALGYTGSMTVADLETWLKVAKNNVAVAHKMWSSSGWSPWGATTCKYKVRCY